MNRNHWKVWAAAALLVALLAGCSGNEDATPTAATLAPEGAATQQVAEQVSPLAVPQSPLTQPASPLPQADGDGQISALPGGPHIDIAVPSDIGVITQLAAETKSTPPQKGMAAISGVLYSPKVNRIIPGTQFYLTHAIEDNGQTYIPSMFVGPKVDKGDVAGISNEKGQVFLDNIPPGKYYMPVWTIYDWLLAFGRQDDEMPLLITLEEGEQLDLGLLYVDWP